MCGISGILMKKGVGVDERKVKTMNDSVSHRGPDADGFYFNGPVGFGHRRLSILDLSELGSQPMHHGDLVITYNGEIFNYIEIREELVAKGYSFKSGSDTEVMLAAYQEWGEQCVNRFNGMWAFAIHDKKKNTVFISRDRFGVKPLYYYEDQSSFYFGSEIRQILTQMPVRKANRQILFDFLFLGYHHHTHQTFFEHVYSLDPGHNISFDLHAGTYAVSKWYSFEVKEKFKNLSFEEAQKTFEATLDNAIRLRLRSDVKV
ncbi:MAG TPA: hypothetical protein VL728_15035, partial [Cyclobacteriaceae bacterium]|nr:hypothetical protein [Cyclobacteriaceae bacterium]